MPYKNTREQATCFSGRFPGILLCVSVCRRKDAYLLFRDFPDIRRIYSQ